MTIKFLRNKKSIKCHFQIYNTLICKALQINNSSFIIHNFLNIVIGAIILCTQNLNAQKVLLKGSGILLPGYYSVGVYDVGIEYIFSQHLTAQVSYSQSFNEGERGHTRRIWTPHIRYYFKENRSLRSSYVSWLVQHDKTSKWTDGIENNRIFYEETHFKKWGTGFMIGWQLPIWKRLGVDFHIGYMAYYGTEDSIKTGNGVQLFRTDKKAHSRPLVGANLYLALGKLTEENKRQKNKKQKNK